MSDLLLTAASDSP
jgi:hypothetical protein